MDANVKVEGPSSLRITAQWPTTVCLGEVAGPDIENAKLVYSAKVKTDLEGTGAAFLELWAHVGGGQYFSKGMNDAVGQKFGADAIGLGKILLPLRCHACSNSRLDPFCIERRFLRGRRRLKVGDRIALQQPQNACQGSEQPGRLHPSL